MRPYGERALLIDTVSPLPLAAATRTVTGVVDVVPGDGSLLVVFADRSARAAFRLPEVASAEPEPGPLVELPVTYDGEDLDEVAAQAGLSRDEVVTLHSGASYVVAMVGFVPGFAYLRGTPEQLHLPRRSSPRTRVPAGSVAVAAGWSGVYPRASPGGWHLLGRTHEQLWDLDRLPPALLRPGTRVRLVAQ